MRSQNVSEFAGELDAAFGHKAIRRALDMMLIAQQQGMAHEQSIFTSAAILLCHERYRRPPLSRN